MLRGPQGVLRGPQAAECTPVPPPCSRLAFNLVSPGPLFIQSGERTPRGGGPLRTLRTPTQHVNQLKDPPSQGRGLQSVATPGEVSQSVELTQQYHTDNTKREREIHSSKHLYFLGIYILASPFFFIPSPPPPPPPPAPHQCFRSSCPPSVAGLFSSFILPFLPLSKLKPLLL